MRPPPSDALPEPDAPARAHSDRVVAAVRAEIAARGGWIPFRRYMEIALYAPGLGYYAAGARKFGAGGDFVTAPEMTPLFARALAGPVEAILDGADARDVLELGAGSGALAQGLLAHVPRVAHYRILDVSGDLRERQRARLAAHGSVCWLDALPPAIDGAVVMNEVLDAIPPHLVARRQGRWYERGVAVRDGRLDWEERPLEDAAVRELAQARWPPQGDYASEVNPAAEALVETIGRRLRSGAMVVLDYGFPASEYYHPQRDAGTLMGHYRHRAHADPFLWPGLSDLTAHVDFTAIALAGERAGLTVAGYGTLAGFLVGAGLLDHLRSVGDPAGGAYMREAAAVQRLLSPAEMGELFKVIVLAKSDSIECPYFDAADHTHRL